MKNFKKNKKNLAYNKSYYIIILALKYEMGFDLKRGEGISRLSQERSY